MSGSQTMFHADRCLAPVAGAVREPALEWRARSTSVCYVSHCGRYEISVHHGRAGARYLCTFYAQTQPRRALPLLMMLREQLDDAFADGLHHLQTGEVRP